MRKKVWLLFPAGPALFSGQDCVLGPGTAVPAQLQTRPWQGWGWGPQAGRPSRHSGCTGWQGAWRSWKFWGPAVGLPRLETLTRDDSAPALHEDPGGPAVATPTLPPPPGPPPGLSGFLHPPRGSGRSLSTVWPCGQSQATGQRSPTCAQLRGTWSTTAAVAGGEEPEVPCCTFPSTAGAPLPCSELGCPPRPQDSQLPSGRRAPECTYMSPLHLQPRAQRPVEPRGLRPSTAVPGSCPSESWVGRGLPS